MANIDWRCTSLTGGGSDALDGMAYVSVSNNDIAITCVSGVSYIHKWNASSAASESSPDTVKIDDQGANTGAWELQNAYATNLDHDALTNFLATEHKTSTIIRAEVATPLYVETRTSDPATAVTGMIWLRTDL